MHSECSACPFPSQVLNVTRNIPYRTCKIPSNRDYYMLDLPHLRSKEILKSNSSQILGSAIFRRKLSEPFRGRQGSNQVLITVKELKPTHSVSADQMSLSCQPPNEWCTIAGEPHEPGTFTGKQRGCYGGIKTCQVWELTSLWKLPVFSLAVDENPH